jgi:HD-GYP domain-containing protein (c-di-GMP phosphodiesterase class II)
MARETQIEDVEHFFARGRERVRLPARGVERLVETTLAVGFVVVAVAMALLLPSPRALSVPSLAILIVAYVVCSRAKFDIADGHTVPTELVLVPMLFLLPIPVVPLAVAFGDLLGRGYDCVSGHTTIHRAFHALGDCWHAVGPALVLVVAGAQVFSWDMWPVYLVALLSQLTFDFVPAAIREHFIDHVPVRTLGRLVAPVYALDVALAPIGLLVAFAATQVGVALALLVLPLAAVLAVLSRERQARVDQAIELSSAYRGTAMLLGDVVEADDAYTGSHSRGVVELSLAVSDQLRLGHQQRRNVEFAALLHDIGKIAVSKEIINKTGPLDPEEWQVMYRHTIEGEEMLNRVGGVLSEVGRIVRSSHEHYDGSGYPDGLAGDEIPIEARIVACCDAFSAMTTNRSYRKAMSVEAALAEVRVCAGTQFDPAVAEGLAVVCDAWGSPQRRS